MSYIAHEKVLGHGLTLTVSHDDGYYDDDSWGEVKITYRSRSRHVLGNQAVTTNEYQRLLAQAERDEVIALPVYAYVHSGSSISTTPFSCSWDSGRSGIAYVTKEFAIKEWGNKNLTKKVRERAHRFIDGYVKYYDDLLQGNVWSYSIHNSDGDVLDNCGGFVGDSEYCLSEGLSLAKRIFEDKELDLAFDVDEEIKEIKDRLYPVEIEVIAARAAKNEDEYLEEIEAPKELTWVEKLEPQSAFF